jgi:hypothetical protein
VSGHYDKLILDELRFIRKLLVAQLIAVGRTDLLSPIGLPTTNATDRTRTETPVEGRKPGGTGQ